MVFSSVPPYLDHHNWHHQLHQSNHHGSGGVGGVIENPNIPSSQPPPPEQQPGGGGGGGGGEGSIRPGSMVDRARLAKLPLPEPGLNCPRCDSTNTKFCYFNNYNLTQPRHFCKTCRRYWTRGGALRNVPVGGGCRRNKRNSKSRSSKSPSQSGTKSLNVSPPRSSSENMTSTQLSLPTSLHLPFMTSLSQYGGVVGNNLSSGIARFPTEIGNFQIGSGNHFQTGGGENWRLPILPGFEVPNNNNLFSYENHGVIGSQPSTMIGGDLRLKSNSGVHDPQIDLPVKVEDNRGLNLSKQFLGMLGNTGQQPWGGNSWAEFPGISTSTPTSHFL